MCLDDQKQHVQTELLQVQNVSRRGRGKSINNWNEIVGSHLELRYV